MKREEEEKKKKKRMLQESVDALFNMEEEEEILLDLGKRLKGLLPVPVITLPLLPLSNSASTDLATFFFHFLQ